MVRVPWYLNSKKISEHYRELFTPLTGPNFNEWLLEETGGQIAYLETIYIEFANDEDYTMFALKWGE